METTEIEVRFNGDTSRFAVNDENMLSEMKGGEFYEIHLLRMVRDLKRSGAYVDVGAAFGNHSVFFAKHCPSNVVFAYEPLNASWLLAGRNFKANGVDGKIVLSQYAVAAKRCKAVMIERPRPGSSSMKEDRDGDIECMPLDDLLPEYSDIAVLKIDVEGNELDVLRGAFRTVIRCRPEVLIETWEDESLAEISDMLLPLGYQLKQRYGNAPTYHFSVDKSIPVTYRKPPA